MTAWPWETPQLPATTQANTPVPLDDTVRKMQRDMAYMVTHTAIMVHSPHEALQMVVNTPRGQIIPRGECKFTDGTVLEFQDIGMPQPGVPAMTVAELMARAWQIASELGLELQP